MRKKKAALAALLMTSVAGLFLAARPVAIVPAHAACDPGDRINNVSMADAKRKIMAAGYTNVREMFKGCDNVWHAVVTTQNGKQGRVALEPGGRIYPEGD